MNQQLAIIVKFHGATNSKGSRFSLTLPRWDNKRRFFGYDHSLNGTLDNASAILKQAGVPIAAVLDLGDHYALAVEWSHQPAVFNMMNRWQK